MVKGEGRVGRKLVFTSSVRKESYHPSREYSQRNQKVVEHGLFLKIAVVNFSRSY